MEGNVKVRIADYPLLVHYGELGEPIDRETAATADFETRFNSVGRLVVGQSIWFYSRRLSAEGRISMDPEDIFLELRSYLQERNSRYSPDLGSYVTFARLLIRHRLSELLEDAHCVALPANASEKLKNLVDLEDSGEITDVQRKRLEALRAAKVDHSSMRFGDFVDYDTPMPHEAVIESERSKVIRDTLLNSIARNLTTRESLALGYAYGLWGRRQIKLSEADRIHGFTAGTMRRALSSAKRKIGESCTFSY